MLRQSGRFDLNPETKLNEFCVGLSQDLDRCTTRDRRMDLSALDVKAGVTRRESR